MKPEEVLVITGRGNQSIGGIGVIRQEVLAMLPALRRRGIVESWREHSPGSIVVKLAPTSALFAVAKRRRDAKPVSSPDEGDLTGLERETVLMLRQLALRNLDALRSGACGILRTPGNEHDILGSVRALFRQASEERKRSGASLRNALEES